MEKKAHAGPLLREWRTRRRLSQLDVSSRTGVSTRHLSCVETGKARPSRELLVFLAEELEIPKRVANDLLLAAGFAPAYTQLGLDDAEMEPIRAVVRLVLDGNDPNPTTVIDTRWNLVDANAAALWLTQGVSPELLVPPINIARLSLHPDGLAGRVDNFDAFAGQLLRHMRHTLSVTHDEELAALIAELEAETPDLIRHIGDTRDVVLPLHIVTAGIRLSFVSTVTTFGTARDVNLSELSIETLYPANTATASVLAARPWLATPGSG